MKPSILTKVLPLMFLGSLAAQDAEYEKLKADAEKFVEEGSHARAHELYTKAAALTLPPEEARWVAFRVADTLWRSQAGTRTPDPSRHEKAEAALMALTKGSERAEARDRVWAEVEESLGDFYWTRPDSRNWGAAWPHYSQAIEWWAASSSIPLARQRYLAIVWKISSPPWKEPYYYYGYYGNSVPIHVLENVLKIATSENEKARAHYLLAMSIRQQGGSPYDLARVAEEFEAALKGGKAGDWYDDALYHYAEWMMNQGRAEYLEDGQVRQQPDFVKALELFRRFVEEHKKGETRYFDQAKANIENITRPVLSVGVSEYFLPGAEAHFQLNWRNVKRIDLALYAVDLSRDVSLAGEAVRGGGGWLQSVELRGREKVKEWSKETGDKGDYRPGGSEERIDQKLPPGAYVLEGRGEGLSARDLVLVTDAALVLKTTGKTALVYAGSVLDGSPIAKARVNLWERSHDGKRWQWREAAKETNADGLALFDIRDFARNTEVFTGLSAGGKQAFATGQTDARQHEEGSWRIYAFTDRPAYRPGEKVLWKMIARTRDGAAYSTPARRNLQFQIDDPRGTKAAEGTLRLNELGSAWSSLELTETMPLGEYRVTFWNEGKKTVLGGDVLFRLEEYKLPEFKVTIQTPEEDGKKKAFRLGERVDVDITAEYYFGGPVADAAVEVLVYQSPFYHTYQEPRDFPWFYEDMQYQPWMHRGQGQIVKRETLRTDSAGKTIISIDTPRGQGQDLEYRIEARVTDSSRREIVGSDSVRVTRQRYYVTPRAEHTIYRPGDTIKVTFKALDSNQEPVVEVEGAVKVTRERWVEIWLSPEGKEVRGEDLAKLRRDAGAFPPAGKPGWRIKFRGYERDDILARTVKTDREGQGELSFPAAAVGFYRIAWRSEDRGGPPVQAEASVWVTTSETTDLAYRHGGLQIILDKDTFRTGEKAHVLITSPVAGRHVLFTVEGEDLHHYELVRLTGTVKLIELDIEEKHVPNIFLGAVLLSDREVFQDTQQVVVPPVRHFLDVEVTADRSEYLPREEATLGVTTRDREGKPVSAEVSIALVDESIFYIQKEYAGDPRQFFFGEKRPLTVRTRTSLEEKRFAPLRAATDSMEVFTGEDGDLGLLQKQEGEFDQRASGRKDMMKNKRFEEGRARGKMQMFSSRNAAPAPGAQAALGAMADAAKEEGGGAAGGAELPAVVVRSDFRSTVLWQPDLRTGEDGKATVKVQLPDSLTRWRASSRVVATENRFGTGQSSFRTRQPLIVRLQAPRFFVVGDTAVVSAVINNNTDRPQAVTASLEAAGLVLKGAIRDGALVEGAAASFTVDARGEARADWLVTATAAGTARLKATGRGEGHADAMEKTYLVHEHGIEKLLSRSGKLRGDSATVKLELPPRKDGSTRLTVQVTPSLAVTMLDALPYLADYPYGCTEQTLSRFLPAVITAKTLKDLGLEPREAMERVFGGIEAASAEKTHPGKKKDLQKLDEMAQQGLERLQDFQHTDGGWGWWKEGESDHFMTAYVVWGLTLARAADLDVKPEVIERGAKFLEVEIVEEEANPDMQAWMLHALASVRGSAKGGGAEFIAKAFENLWNQKEQLNAYTRALFALAAHQLGLAEKAKTLVRNLEDGVKVDLAPDKSVLLQANGSQPEVLGTAHWGEDGIYWRWSEGGVEATAFALRALVAIDPQSKLVEQVTNWLVKNRRGAQWSNTRDTAIVVLALNDYLRKSGELEPNAEYDVVLNGATVVSKKVTPADALNAPSRFTVDAKLLRETSNEVRIVRKKGKSPLYFSVEAVFFSLEEPVLAAGNEIFVKREYQKLAARPTLLKGIVYERAPLGDHGTVKSGERVEVTLTVEAKNNYEYLVFEDLKPAGLEAVEIRSGAPLYARELKESAVERGATASSAPRGAAGEGAPISSAVEEANYTGRTRWVYQELRDRKVALFVDKLPEGIWEIRYELRAEVPGRFHALPVLGHAMYVPEIRANGAETRIEVEDPKPDVAQRIRRAMVGAD